MQPRTRSVGRFRYRRVVVAVTLLASVAACGQDPGSGSGTPEVTLQGVLDDMQVDYGCGHGFYASNAEQTQALFVFASDPRMSADELGIPGEVTFPDDRWDAHVETGGELFANWCDDVIEPGEPEAVTDARFDVIGGTMTVTQDGPDRFTAELVDVEVRTADGTVVDVGGTTATNDLWGVVAG